MQQNKSQEEVRRIIISDMVKKRNSIVPVIGEDTIVYKNGTLPTRCVYQIIGLAMDDSKWISDEDWLLTFVLSQNHKVVYNDKYELALFNKKILSTQKYDKNLFYLIVQSSFEIYESNSKK